MGKAAKVYPADSHDPIELAPLPYTGVYDYEVDWVDWLDTGDTLTGAPVVIADGTKLFVSAVTIESNTAVRFFLQNNIAIRGERVAVTVECVSAGGRTDKRTVIIPVEER